MLIDRNKFVPHGFRFLQPEISNEEWGDPTMSFDVLVRFVIEKRRANPGLSQKHGWSLDYNDVAKEVDEYNTQRCLAHGWNNFIMGATVPFREASPSPLKAQQEAAAGSAPKIVAGIRVLLDWLGSGGKPVEPSVAESRSEICAGCPKNGKGNWTRYFTVPASRTIQLQLELKNNLKLETGQDEKLGVCEACLCPLKLKVWAPMQHILKELTPGARKDLDPRCWITKT